MVHCFTEMFLILCDKMYVEIFFPECWKELEAQEKDI